MDAVLLEALRTLRDIEGVHGSFLVHSGDGRLFGRDLPAVIDDRTLTNIAPRIDRLLDIIDASPPTDSMALRFGDQRLDVKRVGAVELCVLAEARVSAPALRMAMRLVERKLANHPCSRPVQGPQGSRSPQCDP